VILKTLRGCCYLQTSELDGERNLKPKLVSQDIEQNFQAIFVDKTIPFSASFVQPSKDMYFYDGVISLDHGEEERKIEIDLN
jgi:hypothetical protein